MDAAVLPTVHEEEALEPEQAPLDQEQLEAMQLQAQMAAQMGMQAQVEAAGFPFDPSQMVGLEAFPAGPGVPNLMCAGVCWDAGSACGSLRCPQARCRRCRRRRRCLLGPAQTAALPLGAHPAGPPSRHSSCRSRTTCRTPAATRSWP